MSNSYFQFKQFRVEQGRCAMKVTTDACIQGAWTPVLSNVSHVLDVGAGTGLLALMIAQRNAMSIIDAIELDKDAAIEARENFSVSAWHNRLRALEGDACNYVFEEKYDLIISNPPFFNNSLQNDEPQKSMARHTHMLSYKDLIDVFISNLNTDGYVSILLPSAEYTMWKRYAEDAGMHEFKKLMVKHRQDAQAKRVVGLFSLKPVQDIDEQTLVIKDNDGNYTDAFIELLSPFYLDL